MKVISDTQVIYYLNNTLTKESILNEFQPSLLEGLREYLADSSIIPPRVAQANLTDTTHLFMPCISPSKVGIKVISGGPTNTTKGLGFQGGVLVLDEVTGELKGLVSANTLTGFRTALASTLGLTKVISVDSVILPEVTVFGVGRQAYWHIKLALILYDLTTVNVVNGSLVNAEKLVETLSKEFPTVKANAFLYKSPTKSMISHVQNSSIIFGCLPSTEAFIKAEYINSDPNYPKFISLIGSYKPHMYELELLYIEELRDRGVQFVVDSRSHTLAEAGEFVKTGINEDGLVELTELYEGECNTTNITTANNVTVQKLVGLSIMDISMAKHILGNIKGSEVDW